MPSYLCNTLLLPIKKTRTSIKFYEVNRHLRVASFDWIASVKPNDLVVFIDYFGFTFNRNLIEQIKPKGAWILEDASQALLSEGVGQFSDFTLFSPRKYLGVPDGGILSFNARGRRIERMKLRQPPNHWWLKAFSATLLRRDFDRDGVDNNWFTLFQEAESGMPIGNYAMSDLSQALLSYCFDFSKIAQIRVRNYNCLADQLRNLAVFPDLAPGVVPLGFPIVTRNRDRIRKMLFGRHIYAPVHWSINGVISERFEQSHELSRSIMTLPCDQRYNTSDMKRISTIFHETGEC